MEHLSLPKRERKKPGGPAACILIGAMAPCKAIFIRLKTIAVHRNESIYDFGIAAGSSAGHTLGD